MPRHTRNPSLPLWQSKKPSPFVIGAKAMYDLKIFFVDKAQKNFIEKIPQIHFYCIFKQQFSKISKFSNFFVNRAPSASVNPLLGAFGPKKWEHSPHPRGKQIGRRPGADLWGGEGWRPPPRKFLVGHHLGSNQGFS